MEIYVIQNQHLLCYGTEETLQFLGHVTPHVTPTRIQPGMVYSRSMLLDKAHDSKDHDHVITTAIPLPGMSHKLAITLASILPHYCAFHSWTEMEI